MLREQRVYIIEGLMTESFFNTEAEPLTDSEAKKLKDYLNYVRKFINKKNDKNKAILSFNGSDKQFEKRINKFIENAKSGKYSKLGVTVFSNLSYNFIPFKERYNHSDDWLIKQITDFYELNKLCNMNPCKNKFNLKLIHHTGDSDYFSLDLTTLV